MRTTILGVTSAVVLVLGLSGPALACGDRPHNPPPVERSVCWKVTEPDLTNDTAEFPQTFVAEGDANETAQTLCPTSVPKCSDDAEFQFDKYYLRGQDDRDFLDHLEDVGLTRAPGSHHASDDPLQPHDYSDIVLRSSQDHCTPPPPPPPHVKHPHAHAGAHVKDECNCFRDKVTFSWNHGKVRGHVTHPNRTTWILHAHGKRVGNKQFLLPSRLNGNHGWSVNQTYPVHTTNVKCPCHITHTCPHNGPPHHHCPTDGRLSKPCHA